MSVGFSRVINRISTIGMALPLVLSTGMPIKHDVVELYKTARERNLRDLEASVTYLHGRPEKDEFLKCLGDNLTFSETPSEMDIRGVSSACMKIAPINVANKIKIEER